MSLNKLEDLKAKIEVREKQIAELGKDKDTPEVEYKATIVSSEYEIIKLAELGYDCQPTFNEQFMYNCLTIKEYEL